MKIGYFTPCYPGVTGEGGIGTDQVNVKAKTAEKLGPVGEGRAMEARAVALLLK